MSNINQMLFIFVLRFQFWWLTHSNDMIFCWVNVIAPFTFIKSERLCETFNGKKSNYSIGRIIMLTFNGFRHFSPLSFVSTWNSNHLTFWYHSIFFPNVLPSLLGNVNRNGECFQQEPKFFFLINASYSITHELCSHVASFKVVYWIPLFGRDAASHNMCSIFATYFNEQASQWFFFCLSLSFSSGNIRYIAGSIVHMSN